MAGRLLAGVDRAHRPHAASGRWCPPSLDLGIALDNSRLDQTYNTPALATMFLLDQQLRWLNGRGGWPGRANAAVDPRRSVYGWAESSAYATPFVAEAAQRSPVVATIDLDAATVDAGY